MPQTHKSNLIKQRKRTFPRTKDAGSRRWCEGEGKGQPPLRRKDHPSQGSKITKKKKKNRENTKALVQFFVLSLSQLQLHLIFGISISFSFLVWTQDSRHIHGRGVLLPWVSGSVRPAILIIVVVLCFLRIFFFFLPWPQTVGPRNYLVQVFFISSLLLDFVSLIATANRISGSETFNFMLSFSTESRNNANRI